MKLTARERDVLDAMVAGDGSTEDIAGILGVSKGTVKKHVGSISVKTGKATRVGMVVWWIRGAGR